MTPSVFRAVSQLLCAVQGLLHLIDLEPDVARGLMGSARELSLLVGRRTGGYALRQAVARLDADLALVTCRVGLCREVVAAVGALGEVSRLVAIDEGSPLVELEPMSTFDPLFAKMPDGRSTTPRREGRAPMMQESPRRPA